MAKKALALTYRPASFDDVVEQECIVATLKEQIRTNTVHNSVLFCGGAGTGKTTNARIFANEINQFKGNPIEIDAASNSGVDNVRTIIEDAKYRSLDSEYKVYIVDECFAPNTSVSTTHGNVPIKDIQIGDTVNNLIGTGAVINRFTTRVALSRLRLVVLSNGIRIFTTAEHKFFTSRGWVTPNDPNFVGELLFDRTAVHELPDTKYFNLRCNPSIPVVDNLTNTVVSECNCSTDTDGVWDCETVEKWYVNTNTATQRVSNVYDYQHYPEMFTDIVKQKDAISEFVYFYDLEVSGHSSYYVENVLVHNCHMLSNGAWNAMLKLIEEPPAKTIFIFCTTDPQKIPATILSRVQRYDFQRISHDGIVSRLKYILDNEKAINTHITYDMDPLSYIAKLADGGMRDAITLLDKCISFNPVITMENIVKALGTVNYDNMFNLTDAMLKMDGKAVIEIVETIHRSGLDLKQFIKQYSNFVLDLCKYNLLRSFDYLQLPSTYADNLSKYKSADYGFFNQLLGEVITLNNRIKYETIPKPIIESTFLLMCQTGE